MASYPPPRIPPVPPGYDARAQRRFQRDQARAQRDAMRAQQYQMRYQMRSMRRGSILGPILLIAIGIVFLLIQTGRLQHQRFWDFYSREWPLLLVLAGIILLAEWGFDQYQLRDPGTPQYRRSIGGGVFTLLLIFAIIGVGSHEAELHANGPWFNGWQFGQDDLDQFLGDKHESDQTLDLAFPAAGSLILNDPHGDVTVSGTADDNRIHIAVHKQTYSFSDEEANAKVRRLSPAVTTSGSELSLTIPAIEGGRADLVITLPASGAASVTADHGDIHIASIKAGVNATANHGDIDLSAITGPATAHINSHDASVSAHSLAQGITIEGAHAEDVTLSDIAGPVSISGEFYGDTHLERIDGPIHFHTSRTDLRLARLDGEVQISPHSDLTAGDAVGPVTLTTSNRNVTFDRIAGDISITDRNGSIDLTAAPLAGGAALGNISLGDRNGSVHVTLPEQASFTVQADTTNGDISTDLPLTAQTPAAGSRSSREGGRTLTGTVGSGGPLLHIATTNADISLHKAAVAAIPAMPPAPPRLTRIPPTGAATSKTRTMAPAIRAAAGAAQPAT